MQDEIISISLRLSFLSSENSDGELIVKFMITVN